MKKLVLVLLIVFTSNCYSQFKERPLQLSEIKNLSGYDLSELRNNFSSVNLQKDTVIKKTSVKGSKKSSGLAFIYSLAIPGIGQLYANRFDVGKYNMITEAVLWLGYASFTIYGNWLLDDAYNYSSQHAGVIRDGKDDEFFINIGNYNTVEEYNDEMLRTGQYEKVYDAQNGFGFYWDTDENRKRYREDKLAADRIHNDRLFIVGAIVINHFISGISAIVLTNDYNSKLSKAGGIEMKAGVMKNYNNRVDGLKLQMTKWF